MVAGLMYSQEGTSVRMTCVSAIRAASTFITTALDLAFPAPLTLLILSGHSARCHSELTATGTRFLEDAPDLAVSVEGVVLRLS